MRSKPFLLSAGLVTALTIGTIQAAFAQTPVIQNRVAQQVVIGGLRVDAALVIAPGGGVQSYSCPGPQQYVSADGATQGWACFDPTTNVWLLSALPPQQQAQAPAPVFVQQVIQQPVYPRTVVYQYPQYSQYPQYPPAAIVQPTVIYRTPPQVIYAAPVVSSSAVIGAAAINAAGRIAAAVIGSSGHHDHYRNVVVVQNRGRRY